MGIQVNREEYNIPPGDMTLSVLLPPVWAKS